MPVLEARELTKRYRNGTLANDRITFQVEPGEVYGLLGPNGAGKTTLVRQVLGLLKPTAGTLVLDGADIVAQPAKARAVTGFLPQGEFNLDSIRIGEFVTSVARLRGLGRAEAARATDAILERLDLEPYRKTSMIAASGGVRRLAGFAAAVVGDPRLLVLDEPTNDVDPVRRQRFWETVADVGSRGTTVLLVTHNLAEAERVLDRLAIIDEGRIVCEGTPSQLRAVVSDRLRLEVSGADGLAHPALVPEPGGRGRYLLAEGDLSAVAGWLTELRDSGRILDYRIGPPTLDDVYASTVGRGAL